MSSKARTAQHDLRLIEMNELLAREPTEGDLRRMKELYHMISVRHLSPANVEKFMQVADYLKRRENGMDHVRAYRTSLLREKEDEMKIHHCTKARYHDLKRKLKDKAMVPELEKLMRDQVAAAEKAGIPKEVFQSIMTNTIAGMGFRPEFSKSLLKAGMITSLPEPIKGGGSGGEVYVDTPEFDKLIEESVYKSIHTHLAPSK